MEVVKSFSLFGRELYRVERNRSGQFLYSFLDGSNSFAYSGHNLKRSLENPVLMTICAVRSQIYSQMKITHYKGDKVVENSPVLALLKQPNFFQSQNDFLFQQAWFLSACGHNFVYNIKPFANELPKALYNLIPNEIDLNNAHKVNKFIVTKQDQKAFGERKIKYTLDNQVYELRLADLIPLYDLSNGLTNNSFFQSESRVNGIKHILCNIDENIKAKNTNLQMTQKYLSKNESTGNEAQIQDTDRKDIENKIGQKSLIITNATIDVKHLVSDMKRLYLDEQFADDANKCLLGFGMNKNILNYFAKDSTFENQNQGLISFIQNEAQNMADNTMNSLSQQLGLFEKGERLEASFDHMPVMQSVMNEKIKTFTEMQNAVKIGLETQTLDAPTAKQMVTDLKLKLKL